ncbi:MAG: hypothetical protein D6730_03425 [Bacteroidetes bacterium]|nr:MAG: hypothetical protein D6730_03425 [Bacteroidota bacterium]
MNQFTLLLLLFCALYVPASAQWAGGLQLGFHYQEAGRQGFSQAVPTYGNYDQRRTALAPSLFAAYRWKGHWMAGLRIGSDTRYVHHHAEARYRSQLLAPELLLRRYAGQGTLRALFEAGAGYGHYLERFYDPPSQQFLTLKKGSAALASLAAGLACHTGERWQVEGLLRLRYERGQTRLQIATADTETFYRYEIRFVLGVVYVK